VPFFAYCDEIETLGTDAFTSLPLAMQLRKGRWFRTLAMNLPQIYDSESDPVE
jgi:hypothetical protein